jgi:L1 cell adhesion molecule like protein
MGFAWRSHWAAAAAAQAGPGAVGIDLGTSYGRIAIWQDGDALIVPNDRGSLSTPSCVAFAAATPQGSDVAPCCVLVGEAAEEQAGANLENTIFAPQRLIGSKFENPWVQCYVRQYPYKVIRGEGDRLEIQVRTGQDGEERSYRPEVLVALLLADLRRTAERHLGVTIVNAVVTIPSRFGRNQREALLEACKGARLHVLDLLKAPTGGAIAYALAHDTRARRNVLVCDIGASYFDFSLFTIEEDGGLLERAIGTDFVDFDACLVRFCTQDLQEKWDLPITGHPMARQKLRRACELAKRKLSQSTQARIQVENIHEGRDYVCNLSRVHFDELIKADIAPLLDPVEWCLEDCGLEKHDVHEVVLVGGSARIPGLRRAVREFFVGKKPLEVLRPEHAAVLGAAAYAAVLAGEAYGDTPPELGHLRVVQVTPWSTTPGAPLIPGAAEAAGNASDYHEFWRTGSATGEGDAAGGRSCRDCPQGGMPGVQGGPGGPAGSLGSDDACATDVCGGPRGGSAGRKGPVACLAASMPPSVLPPKPAMRPSFSELPRPSSLGKDGSLGDAVPSL